MQSESEARREAYRSQHSQRIVPEGDHWRKRGANDAVTKIVHASKAQASGIRRIHERKRDENARLAPSVSHRRCHVWTSTNTKLNKIGTNFQREPHSPYCR